MKAFDTMCELRSSSRDSFVVRQFLLALWWRPLSPSQPPEVDCEFKWFEYVENREREVLLLLKLLRK